MQFANITKYECNRSYLSVSVISQANLILFSWLFQFYCQKCISKNRFLRIAVINLFWNRKDDSWFLPHKSLVSSIIGFHSLLNYSFQRRSILFKGARSFLRYSSSRPQSFTSDLNFRTKRSCFLWVPPIYVRLRRHLVQTFFQVSLLSLAASKDNTYVCATSCYVYIAAEYCLFVFNLHNIFLGKILDKFLWSAVLRPFHAERMTLA